MLARVKSCKIFEAMKKRKQFFEITNENKIKSAYFQKFVTSFSIFNIFFNRTPPILTWLDKGFVSKYSNTKFNKF